MERENINIIAGNIPWIKGVGAIDDKYFSGGWEDALAKSDGFGWRLSLLVKDPLQAQEKGNIISKYEENEFPITDLENPPKFDVRKSKIHKNVDTAFNEEFKKYFGEFIKVEEKDIVPLFEKARALLEKGDRKEAYTIMRDIGLSLFYQEEQKKYKEQTQAYFEGIDFEHFSASEYAAIKSDPTVTTEDILRSMKDYDFGKGKHYTYEEIRERVKKAEQGLSSMEETIDMYRLLGDRNTAQYTPERTKLHIKILEELIVDKLEKFIPEGGEDPTLILLGGRGGSGKSKFKGLVYDNHFVVLDPDAIKRKLPEYKGWNATEVHEESSDIMEQALLLCMMNGLNVVVDSSMKTAKSVERRFKMFRDKGYQIEAHYMFLPPQKSARRAVARFLTEGEKGRYMPIDVVLSNKTNEETFDKIKENVDAWSFYEGDVKRGERPFLIASGGRCMSYMEKKKSKYMFDLSDENEVCSNPENEALNELNKKIKAKMKKIMSGER